MSRRFDDLDNKGGGFNDSEKLAEAPVDDHSSTSGSSGGAPKAYFDKVVNGKRVLTEEMVDPSVLGYGWSTRKKYAILTVIATLQISLNFNTSIYPNAVTGVSETFSVSEAAARVGQLGYLIPYAFGCELWAPWSEVYGRWPILQLSLFLVNCFSLLQALAQNYAQMMVGRFLAGLSSAGGSVTLGVVADLFDADTQQYAVAYIVWSSVSGTTVGPIVGGFVQSFAPTWRWISWLQLIFNGFTMCLMWLIPETRSTILLDKEAKRRRKEAVKAGKPEPNIWGPNEVAEQRITVKEVVVTFYRPFELFLTEPIVLFCSLLSGFSDMLIFIFLESFNPVFSQYGFQPWNTGLAFVAVWIGYFIGWASFLPFIHRDNKQRAKDRYSVSPERRLYWLLWTGPLEAIGLFGFAWSSLPPDQYQTHWIAPMIFACLIGIANYCIYMATIDYMVAAYGPYSSSATGGNGFARDFLAGISAMFAAPFYHHFDTYTLAYPSTILACIAATLVAPIFLLYWKGPEIRRRSRFAQSLNEEFESTKVRKQVRDEKATGRSKHIEHSEGV